MSQRSKSRKRNGNTPDINNDSNKNKKQKIDHNDSESVPTSLQLIELFEYHCCVCKELSAGQILQCSNGCILCEGCYQKLNPCKCPLCRVTMSRSKPIRCRIAERTLALRLIKCKYDGCGQEVPFGEMQQHETQECLYKPVSCTLYQAIGEVLYVGQHSYEQVKNMIASRTPLSCNEPDFSKALNLMATFYEPTMHYYLKPDYHEQVEWEKSEILTKNEKQVIRDRTRNADDDPETQEFERQYAVICEQQKYNEYNTVYNEKLQSVQEWAQNIQVNKDYFKRMRKLINDEQDADKKAKMMSEFRIIFEERKPNIKHLQQMVNRTRLELFKTGITDCIWLQAGIEWLRGIECFSKKDFVNAIIYNARLWCCLLSAFFNHQS